MTMQKELNQITNLVMPHEAIRTPEAYESKYLEMLLELPDSLHPLRAVGYKYESLEELEAIMHAILMFHCQKTVETMPTFRPTDPENNKGYVNITFEAQPIPMAEFEKKYPHAYRDIKGILHSGN